jgi:hypothetical protein
MVVVKLIENITGEVCPIFALTQKQTVDVTEPGGLKIGRKRRAIFSVFRSSLPNCFQTTLDMDAEKL